MTSDGKAKTEKLADEYLAVEELQRLHGISGSILDNIGERRKALERELNKAACGRGRKAQQTIESELKRSKLSLSFLRDFDGSLAELQKLADQIEDERLRYGILFCCRNMVEDARMLGNIARRDLLDEERDRLNGRRPKHQKAEAKKRQLEVEAKILEVLRGDPAAEWPAAWRKVYAVGPLRNLASRNTLEKDARAAYQKHFIEPPR
jgi:hypothetical protein